ncbi:MAG: GntR family transcriptional regulator [Dermatophilaceae bacterium]
MGSVRTRGSAYRRVASDLRAQIRDEAFPPETPMPTEAEIAGQYSVSRQTVRRAFQDLVAEGLVRRVPGRGTFATSRSRYLRHFGSIEDLMALSADSQMRMLRPLGSTVDHAAADRLRLSDDHVATATFARLHGGEVFCHTQLWLPPQVRDHLGDVEELASPGALSQVTVIALLDEVLPAPIQGAEQTISVAAATSEVAEALALPLGTALLRIDRTYYDTDDDPVELAVSHFHPDRYSYRVRLRRHVI